MYQHCGTTILVPTVWYRDFGTKLWCHHFGTKIWHQTVGANILVPKTCTKFWYQLLVPSTKIWYLVADFGTWYQILVPQFWYQNFGTKIWYCFVYFHGILKNASLYCVCCFFVYLIGSPNLSARKPVFFLS